MNQKRRIVALAVGVIGVCSLYLALRPSEQVLPLHIAVSEPQVEGDDGTVDLVKPSLSLAITNAFAMLDEVYPIEAQYTAINEDEPSAIARAVAADEVLMAGAQPSSEGLVVHLTRYSSAGGVVWESERVLPTKESNQLVTLVSEELLAGYSDRRRSRNWSFNSVDNDDITEYLEINEQIKTNTSNLDTLEALHSLRTRAPNLIDAYLLEVSVASYLYRATRHEEYLSHARQTLEDARSSFRDDPRLMLAIADFYLDVGELDALDDTLRKMERVFPHHPSLARNKAWLFKARGEFDIAIETLKQEIEERPSWPYLAALADIEMGQGKQDDAREHLREALEYAPTHIMLLGKLGEWELRWGDISYAEDVLLEAVISSPRPMFLLNLGTAHLLLGRYEEAMYTYEEGVVLGSQHPILLLSLADAYLILGDERALETYQRVVRQMENPKTPVDLAVKAYCRARCGDIDTAWQEIDEAYSRNPENLDIQYYAAYTAAAAGDIEKLNYWRDKALANGLNSRWFSLPFFREAEEMPN